MAMAMDIFEVRRRYVRIELGGLHLPVAQLLLDAEDVSAPFQHMRGTAVANDMGRDFFLDA